MRIKVPSRVFVRIVMLLLLCAVLLSSCIGQKSQAFPSGMADILSAPYQKLSASASFDLTSEAASGTGGLLPQKFILTAEGEAAHNFSEYYLNISIKQPAGKQEELLYIYGTGGSVFVQAKSYPYLLPELLYYKEYINCFEYEHLKEVLESGTALRIDASSLLSSLSGDNQAVLFFGELLEDHSSLNYSTLYSSLSVLASDSVDKLDGGLPPSAYGMGWVRYKADGAALSKAVTGAFLQLEEYAGKASQSLEDFLTLNRSSFSSDFLAESKRAKEVGGVVPDFDTYEKARFDILLADADDTAQGLKALSHSLSEKVSEHRLLEEKAGIKASSEITLSATSDKFTLSASTMKKKGAQAYMSSEFKLTVSRGTSFSLLTPKSAELDKVLWEAARDYYKSEENKAVFLRLDYNSLTATVTTAAQQVHSYPIQGITLDYFASATHDGSDTPGNAAIVPVRLACEIFGEDVGWDASSQRAYVVRMSGEGEKKLYISGTLCGDKLFSTVKELQKLDIVCFGDNIYDFELAR
ncbi:MAG: hypothetical protein AB9835_03525 [Eubacteriales bacterium]